jgi:hypothetical protein
MNSEYKKLAQERTILLALVGLAKEKFLPPEGEDDPEVKLSCEELPLSDSVIPEDPIIDVVLKLQKLAHNRELQMAKYRFVATKEQTYEQEWAEEDQSKSPPAQVGAPAAKGKGKGGKGSPQAPAAGRGGQKPAPAGAPAKSQ